MSDLKRLRFASNRCAHGVEYDGSCWCMKESQSGREQPEQPPHVCHDCEDIVGGEQPAQVEPQDELVTCATCAGTGMGIEGEKEGCETCNGHGYGVRAGDKATERETPRREGHSALRVKDGKIEKFDPHPAPSPSGMNAEQFYNILPLHEIILGKTYPIKAPAYWLKFAEAYAKVKVREAAMRSAMEIAKLREERDVQHETIERQADIINDWTNKWRKLREERDALAEQLEKQP